MGGVKALECVYRQSDITQRRTARSYTARGYTARGYTARGYTAQSLSAHGQRVGTPKPEGALFSRDMDLDSLTRLLLRDNASYGVNSRGALKQSDFGAADTVALEPTKYQNCQNIPQPPSQNLSRTPKMDHMVLS